MISPEVEGGWGKILALESFILSPHPPSIDEGASFIWWMRFEIQSNHKRVICGREEWRDLVAADGWLMRERHRGIKRNWRIKAWLCFSWSYLTSINPFRCLKVGKSGIGSGSELRKPNESHLFLEGLPISSLAPASKVNIKSQSSLLQQSNFITDWI